VNVSKTTEVKSQVKNARKSSLPFIYSTILKKKKKMPFLRKKIDKISDLLNQRHWKIRGSSIVTKHIKWWTVITVLG
jgi:hypothetical protein